MSTQPHLSSSSASSASPAWRRDRSTFRADRTAAAELSPTLLDTMTRRAASYAFTRTETDSHVELSLDRTYAGCRLRVDEVLEGTARCVQTWIGDLPFFLASVTPTAELGSEYPNGPEVSREVWERTLAALEVLADPTAPADPVLRREVAALAAPTPPTADVDAAANLLTYRLSRPMCELCVNRSSYEFVETFDAAVGELMAQMDGYVGFVTATERDVAEHRTGEPAALRSAPHLVAHGVPAAMMFSGAAPDFDEMLWRLGAGQLWTSVRVVLPRATTSSVSGRDVYVEVTYLDAARTTSPPAPGRPASEVQVGGVSLGVPRRFATDYMDLLPLEATAVAVARLSGAADTAGAIGADVVLTRSESTWLYLDADLVDMVERNDTAYIPAGSSAASVASVPVASMVATDRETFDLMVRVCEARLRFAPFGSVPVAAGEPCYVSDLSWAALSTLFAVTGLADRPVLRQAFSDLLGLASLSGPGPDAAPTFFDLLTLASAVTTPAP